MPCVSLKLATHLAILYANCHDRRKSADVPVAAIASFAISDRSDSRRHSPSVLVPAIFYGLRIASKANPSGWVIFRILSHDFSKLPHRCDRRKKSPSVSASNGGENRWRSNLLRSAYQIARCVTGFSSGNPNDAYSPKSLRMGLKS